MPKADLVFSKPVMNAAGMLGFAPDFRAPVPWQDFGAFITNPISLRPRPIAEHPLTLEYPGGFLVHTGLPNPGFSATVTRYQHRWADSSTPIIVHLMADRPDEAGDMARRLEDLENVMAIELGFAPLLSDDLILMAVEKCRGELPLIACLPAEQVLRLGPRAQQAGAAAISLAAPRGALTHAGATVTGRLYGPSLFPQSLDLVRSAAKLGLTCIAAGGIWSTLNVQAMIAAGAIAVRIDAQLWIPEE